MGIEVEARIWMVGRRLASGGGGVLVGMAGLVGLCGKVMVMADFGGNDRRRLWG